MNYGNVSPIAMSTGVAYPSAYGPPKAALVMSPISKELLDSLRAEFRKLVDGDGFQNNLHTIARLAEHAQSIVMTLGSPVAQAGPPSIQPGFEITTLPPMSNPEQFGAKAIRELVAVAPRLAEAFARAPNDSPEKLVEAVKKARDLGMDELAERIEARLLDWASPPDEPEQGHEHLNGASGALEVAP
jgi:hypothetical protein